MGILLRLRLAHPPGSPGRSRGEQGRQGSAPPVLAVLAKACWFCLACFLLEQLTHMCPAGGETQQGQAEGRKEDSRPIHPVNTGWERLTPSGVSARIATDWYAFSPSCHSVRDGFTTPKRPLALAFWWQPCLRVSCKSAQVPRC